MRTLLLLMSLAGGLLCCDDSVLRAAVDAKSPNEWRAADGPGADAPPGDRGSADGSQRDGVAKVDKTSKLDGTSAPDAAIVGNPALFTQSVFEMDFSQGANGKYRANGGAWQDFNAWSQAGSNGGWSNAGVYVQTTSAVRTELVANTLGAGKVLRTWIQAGDQWKSGAAYPRTELTSSSTGNIAWKSEWRLEMPFYAAGEINSSGDTIIAFQLHHNGSTGSPPFGLYMQQANLRFRIEEKSSGPVTSVPIITLQANTHYDLVVELKFGYVSDGAYVKLWLNGKQYVNITNLNVGYPDVESTAGYWKFCSLYDWGNTVKTSRSVYSGPTFKLLRRP